MKAEYDLKSALEIAEWAVEQRCHPDMLDQDVEGGETDEQFAAKRERYAIGYTMRQYLTGERDDLAIGC